MAQADAKYIEFQAGKSTGAVEGSFTGYDEDEYLIRARAGQTLSFDLKSRQGSAHVNIYKPGDRPGEATALVIGSTTGPSGEVTLPESGAYLLQVYQMRASARRDERVNYSLSVSITGGSGSGRADAASAGTGWWQVEGVESSLILRETPSSSAAVMGRIRNQEKLRDLGCRDAGGSRWCQVETASGTAGWVSGGYLRRADAPDPDRPNTFEFDAVSQAPCSVRLGQPTSNCQLGVIRKNAARGDADITLFWPDGGRRELVFRQGQLTSPAAKIERRGDLTVVTIDAERYEIPDMVIFGG